MKRGRPPLDENDPSVNVNVRMPSKHYDHLYDRARRERVSVPEVVRRDIRQAAAKKGTLEK